MAQRSCAFSMLRFIWLSSRRSRIAAFALMALAALVLLALSLRKPVPPPSGLVVRGKPIEQWVDEMVRRGDYEAVNAIREAGTNVAPFLRKPLARQSTRANTLYVKLSP